MRVAHFAQDNLVSMKLRRTQKSINKITLEDAEISFAQVGPKFILEKDKRDQN